MYHMCKKCNLRTDLQKNSPKRPFICLSDRICISTGNQTQNLGPRYWEKCHNFVENMVRIKSEGLRIPNQFRSSGTFLKTMAGNIWQAAALPGPPQSPTRGQENLQPGNLSFVKEVHSAVKGKWVKTNQYVWFVLTSERREESVDFTNAVLVNFTWKMCDFSQISPGQLLWNLLTFGENFILSIILFLVGKTNWETNFVWVRKVLHGRGHGEVS